MPTPHSKGPGRLQTTEREHCIAMFAVYREMAHDSLREARRLRKPEDIFLRNIALRYAREHAASARSFYLRVKPSTLAA